MTRFPEKFLRLTTCFALVAVLPGCSDASENRPDGAAAITPQKTDLPAGAYRLQNAEIVDRQGFGRVMPAYHLFIPAGWQAQGEVMWQDNPAECGTGTPHIAWVTQSPDGSRAIELIPEEVWSGHNMTYVPAQGPCPNITITNVRDYIAWWVQRNRPQARVENYRPRPEFTEPMQHLNSSEAMQGFEIRNWVEGGEALLAYNHQGGEIHETIGIAVLFSHTRMAGVVPGEIREFLTINAMPGIAARAPAGALDNGLTETLRRSIRPAPEWQAQMMQYQQAMSNIAAKGAADRHAIRMQSIREIGEINRSSYENRQASADRGMESFSQAIRGVATYTDPVARENVELPDTHHNVWRLNDGTFILTDDSNFSPYRDIGVDGRRLEQSR